MKVCKKVYITPRGESSSASADATALEFRFANGTARKVALAAFPPSIAAAFTWHGLSQKLGDAFASSQTVDEALEAFDSVKAQLVAGEWTTRVIANKLASLAAAVAVAKGVTVEKALETLEALSDEQVAAVRKHPAIKAELAKQAAARAETKAKGSNAEALEDILGL